jgi:hypothetical protein
MKIFQMIILSLTQRPCKAASWYNQTCTTLKIWSPTTPWDHTFLTFWGKKPSLHTIPSCLHQNKKINRYITFSFIKEFDIEKFSISKHYKRPMVHITHLIHFGPYLKVSPLYLHLILWCGPTLPSGTMILIKLIQHYFKKLSHKSEIFWLKGSLKMIF